MLTIQYLSGMKRSNQPIPKIIYEDNHLFVIEKPIGWLSQPDGKTPQEDAVAWIKHYLKRKYDKPGDVFLGIVHRLDRNVGGVMVYAKTSKAASRLSEQIRKRTFDKRYLAVVEGLPDDHDVLSDRLAKDHKRNKVHKNDLGKDAKLEFERLNYHDGSKSALVSIKLITGRSHQIRAQFSQRGHPLLGDRKYGAKKNEDVDGISLWAYSLQFFHPTTKEKMTFTAPPDIRKKPWAWFQHVFQ